MGAWMQTYRDRRRMEPPDDGRVWVEKVCKAHMCQRVFWVRPWKGETSAQFCSRKCRDQFRNDATVRGIPLYYLRAYPCIPEAHVETVALPQGLLEYRGLLPRPRS